MNNDTNYRPPQGYNYAPPPTGQGYPEVPPPTGWEQQLPPLSFGSGYPPYPGQVPALSDWGTPGYPYPVNYPPAGNFGGNDGAGQMPPASGMAPCYSGSMYATPVAPTRMIFAPTPQEAVAAAPRAKGSRPKEGESWYHFIANTPTRRVGLSDKSFVGHMIDTVISECKSSVSSEHINELMIQLNHFCPKIVSEEMIQASEGSASSRFCVLMGMVRKSFSVIGEEATKALGEALVVLNYDPVINDMLEVLLGQMDVSHAERRIKGELWDKAQRRLAVMDPDALLLTLKEKNLFPAIALTGHENHPDCVERMMDALKKMVISDPSRHTALCGCFMESGGINAAIAPWLNGIPQEHDAERANAAKECIDSNLDMFVQSLDAKDLGTALIANKLITQYQKDELDAMSTTRERAERVFRIVNKWLLVDSDAIDRFIEVLETSDHTGHQYIREKLRGTIKPKRQIAEESESGSEKKRVKVD